MSQELDEVMRRCEAAGLEFSDEGQEIVIYIPGTDGVYVMDGPQAQWTMRVPFEEYEALEKLGACWSPVRQTIECNIVQLGRGTQGDIGIGWEEYLASWGEDLDEIRQTVMHGRPRSREEKRLELIQQILLRLVQGKPEQLEAYTDPRRRISIDIDNELDVSIGLSSDVHSLLQESFEDRSLTLQIRGEGLGDRDTAIQTLVKIADSVFFAIDESLGLPLALERTSAAGLTVYPRSDSFPLPTIESEYSREAMALYWSARATASMPTVQFLSFYHVLEYFFLYSRDPRDGTGGEEGKMLDAVIRRSLTSPELHAFLAENEGREAFFYGSPEARTLSRFVFKAPGKGRHDPRETASRRIRQIRNRIVHAKSGRGRPLPPYSSEAQGLTHDIDLVKFLSRRALMVASRPLQV